MTGIDMKRVFDERLSKAQKAMVEYGFDFLFIPAGINQRYISGLTNKRRERLYAVVIPQTGEAVVVCPAFELDRQQKQIGLAVDRFLTWEEHENPYTLVATAIGKGKPTIGIDPKAWFNEVEPLTQALPAAKMVGAYDLFTSLRMRKDDWEKEMIKEAIDINETAREVMFDSLRDGMKESEAVAKFEYEAVTRGGENPHPHAVSVGINTGFAHSGKEEAWITDGTVIRVDSGVFVEGYRGDVTRMAVFGTSPKNFDKVFDIVLRSQQAALAAITPGMPLEELDQVARDVIENAGYGKYFTHRLGHGIGMEVHEPPWVAKGEKAPLEVGMTFTVEPGIYFPGEFGVRLEDNVVVTQNGCELLSPPVEDYRRLPAK